MTLRERHDFGILLFVGPPGCEGKVLSPAAKRHAVDMLTTTFSMSERLACKAVGLARSTYRRRPQAQTPADPDTEMRAWLRSYAHQTSLPRIPARVGRVALRRAP